MTATTTGSRTLVQWLLPLRDNDGRRFPPSLYAQVRTELTERFGGVTAYQHAPAVGLWEDAGEVQHDELVLFEVVVEDFDRAWWAGYRDGLCVRFRQETILLRAIGCELL
jgi:hypothetical protein